MAQRPDGECDATSMTKVVPHGHVFVLLRIFGLGARVALWRVGPLLTISAPTSQRILGWVYHLAHGRLDRLPSLTYSSTARILSSYESMNYHLVVQVFVRPPGGSILLRHGHSGGLPRPAGAWKPEPRQRLHLRFQSLPAAPGPYQEQSPQQRPLCTRPMIQDFSGDPAACE